MDNRLAMAIIALSLILLSNSAVADYNATTVIGDSVFIEDSEASLRVTPHTATSPVNKYKQEFEVCNKTGVTTNLYAGYIFDKALTAGKVEYWQKPVNGWVGHDYNCPYDYNVSMGQDGDYNPNYAWCYISDVNGSGQNQIVFQHEFKEYYIVGGKGSIRYYTSEIVSGNNWHDVTTPFITDHNILSNGKHIYPYLAGLPIAGTSCEKWKIEYTPNTNDDTKKWDLWLWTGTTANCILTDTCLKTLKLDPWWNGSYLNKRQIKFPKTSTLGTTIALTWSSNEFANALTNLNDLRIVDDSGSPTELERTCEGTKTAGVCLFRLNRYATTSETNFYAYYNNSAASAPTYYGLDANAMGFEDDEVLTSVQNAGTISSAVKKYGAKSYLINALPATGLKIDTALNDANSADYNYSAWIYIATAPLDGYVNRMDILSDTNVALCAIGFLGLTGGGMRLRDQSGTQHNDGGYPVTNTWYNLQLRYVNSSNKCYATVRNENGTDFTSWENTPDAQANIRYFFLHADGAGGLTHYWDNVFYGAPTEASGLEEELSQNTAPYTTSIDLNASYAKQNDHIKVTASGAGDAESNALTLLCGTSANPTIDSNNFCTAYGIASPYSDVSCTGNGLTGDGSKTIYCRIYDGALYSIDQNTDTYTADNTTPSISSVIINASENLIGIDYDLNMTITESGSGLATTTYKCWSSGSSEETCTEASWDCKTGNLTNNGSNNYGATVDGTLKDTSGTWTCKAYATDNVGLQGTGTDTETMNETTGYTVDTTTITYSGAQGTTENPALTDQANAYIIFTHNGNTDLNLLNNCDNLTYTAYTIPKENQKWLDTDNYAGANTCTGLNQEIDTTWDKGTYPTYATKNVYFWLDVPVAQAIGNYTGTITVGATKSG